MDYWCIVVESWRVARTERGLWPLGALEGVSALIAASAITLVTVPLSLAMVTLTSALSPRLAGDAADLFGVFRPYLGVWTLACVVLFAAWVVAGIYGVAATGGIIDQVDAAQSGITARAAAGLSAGFAHWWRVAGLLALVALPSLVLLLAHTGAFYATFVLPVLRGGLPSLALMNAANGVLSPLDWLVSFAAIPLGVLVQLALRFGVLDGLEWRPAFGAAWRLARAALSEVVLMYFVVLAASFVLALAMTAVFGLVLVVLVGGAIVATVLQSYWLAVVLAVVAFACLAVFGVGAAALLAPFSSALWTLFWRGVTGRDARFITNAALSFPDRTAPPVHVQYQD